MVTLQKIDDSSVKFVFEDSDHYLFGDGEIVVPVNSLSLVIDDSEMVTFKKSATGDPFISFRADNSNLGTKAAIEAFYKENMVGGSGGVSEEEVQEMIDAATSGIPSSQVIEQLRTDVNTVSGQAQTNASDIEEINEKEEVIASALTEVRQNKQDKLQYYEENTEEGYAEILIRNDDGEGSTEDNHINIGGGVAEIGIYNEYDDGQGNVTANNASIYADQIMVTLQAGVTENGDTTSTDLMVEATGVTINGDAVATEPYVDDVISGKVDTSAITSAITSASTNDEVAGAKAVYDAIQAGGGGSITVDPTLDSGSTNPVANSAITNAFNSYTIRKNSDNGEVRYFYWTTPNSPWGGSTAINNFSINGRCPLTQTNGSNSYIDKFNLVETSAITTSITSSSTDAQVPSAKATYDAIQAGGGGATYSAGTNISIANDTINCTLPITANTNNLQGYLLFGSNISVWGSESNGRYQIAIGKQISNPAYAQGQVAICPADTSSSSLSELTGDYPIGIGHSITSRGNGAVAIGDRANANGNNYVAIGTANATGTTKMNLNDQIKVDTNNQVYIKDKTNTTDVCIQDAIAALGGLSLVKITQAAYDALVTKDANTLYIISNVVS